MATTATRSPAVESSRGALPSWWGWVVVALIALATLLTWLPVMDLPLGDTNEGRILARLAIHAQNFWEKGPAGSSWATDFSPYHLVTNYAHHPPLTNLAHVVVAGTLGQAEWQLRLFGYLSGVATLVLIPALLRCPSSGVGPNPARHRRLGGNTFLLDLWPGRRWVRVGCRVRRRRGDAPAIARSSALGGLGDRRAGRLHRDALLGGGAMRRSAVDLAGHRTSSRSGHPSRWRRVAFSVLG